jgi:hypothetical protein
MRNHTPTRYKRAAVIVHGKSERFLASYIYTNLHLPVEIIDKQNGKSSIQINALQKILSGKPFNSLKSFAETYSIEYDKKNKTLKSFKLFIIMDTDDCSDQAKEEYISGKMFESSCLKDYIVPIYNSPNLEEVMIKAGIMTKRISDSQKGSYYSKVFPINQEPFSNDTLKQIQSLSNKLQGVKETNLLEYIDYCLSLINQV